MTWSDVWCSGSVAALACWFCFFVWLVVQHGGNGWSALTHDCKNDSDVVGKLLMVILAISGTTLGWPVPAFFLLAWGAGKLFVAVKREVLSHW